MLNPDVCDLLSLFVSVSSDDGAGESRVDFNDLVFDFDVHGRLPFDGDVKARDSENKKKELNEHILPTVL